MTQMKCKTSNRWPKRTVENFLDSWNSDMAYILGYFAADGTMYKNKRGSCYIAFTSTDKPLIELVKKQMNVANAIESYNNPARNWKTRYVLQIGSKKLYERLLKLGFTANKSLSLVFPDVPDNVLGHFLRGYFDGDGSVSFAFYKRKNRNNNLQKVFDIRLRCGSKNFIESLQKKLVYTASVSNGRLYFHSRAYELVYRTKDVIKLYGFMYQADNLPCLERKRNILKEGIKSYGIEV